MPNKAKVEYSIGGQFRFDLYKEGQFVSGTEWFSNFITQTGLIYPLNYNFVDCFRFLSLGNGTILNSGQKVFSTPTTGLNSPITGINTTAGSQPATYIGWQGYETGTAGQQSACGTSLTENGPRFFRAWTIPTGDISVTVNDPNGFLSIQEFMVSPSSGADPTGRYAFSRIVRNLSIPNGYKAVISYQLKVNVQNTGITPFYSGTFTTGNADVSNDLVLVSSWGNLSGYYRQVYHGLVCIDANGASYIPKFGAGMEPNLINMNSLCFYLSPDNSNFDVNGQGGNQTDVVQAYAADGLMDLIEGIPLTLSRDFSSFTNDQLNAIYYTPISLTATDTSFPSNITPTNIRLGDASISISDPLLSNYTQPNGLSNFTYQAVQDPSTLSISYATPGGSGFNPSLASFGQKAVFSTKIYKLPFNQVGQNLPTGRKKTLSRKTLFSPVSSLGWNTRFGSLVFGYAADTATFPNKVIYPMIDCLFFDSSGRSLMEHYRLLNGIVFTERGSGIADARISLFPSSGNNIQRLANIQTFQGPYNPSFVSGIDLNHPVVQKILTNGDSAGVIYSGNVSTTSIGDINNNVVGSGWGTLYGVIASDSYYSYFPDVGLTDHSTGINFPPNETGFIYWPSIQAGNQIQLSIHDIKFFTTGVGIIKDTGWFDTGHQIVDRVEFIDRNNSCGGSSILPNIVTDPIYFSGGAPIGASLTEWGYYLSTSRYNYQVLTSADNGNFITNANSFTISGFVDTNSNASCSRLTGAIPAIYLRALPNTGLVSLIFANDGGGFTVSNAITITGFFTGITDRGYTTGINNVPITANQPLEFYISGFSSSLPLYLTYLFYTGFSQSVMAHSYLNPIVYTTTFKRPTGYIAHAENVGTQGWRLLPNYGTPNNQMIDTYTATQGGQYPGLSLDNGLELYLDMSWSSPCGGATDCNEPI